MTKPLEYLITIVVAVGIAYVAFYYYEKDERTPPSAGTGPMATTTTPPTAGMANPASVFCVQSGGTLSMRESAQGMTGMCTFADGSMCEEWALFRGECDIEGVSKRAIYKNDTETVTAIYRIKESTVVVTAPAHNLEAIVIPQAMSASGARYATTDGHLEFWEHQGEGMLSIDNAQVFTGKIQ